MAAKLAPGVEAGNAGSIRALHRDEELVAERVGVKAGGDIQPAPEALAVVNGGDGALEALQDLRLWLARLSTASQSSFHIQGEPPRFSGSSL
jgi:hypothetical protein